MHGSDSSSGEHWTEACTLATGGNVHGGNLRHYINRQADREKVREWKEKRRGVNQYDNCKTETALGQHTSISPRTYSYKALGKLLQNINRYLNRL